MKIHYDTSVKYPVRIKHRAVILICRVSSPVFTLVKAMLKGDNINFLCYTSQNFALLHTQKLNRYIHVVFYYWMYLPNLTTMDKI